MIIKAAMGSHNQPRTIPQGTVIWHRLQRKDVKHGAGETIASQTFHQSRVVENISPTNDYDARAVGQEVKPPAVDEGSCLFRQR